MTEHITHLIGTGHLFRKEKNLWIMLASKSERRIQLMNMIGIGPLYICPSLFDETLNKANFPTPEMYVLETAKKKGEDVASHVWDSIDENETNNIHNKKEKVTTTTTTTTTTTNINNNNNNKNSNNNNYTDCVNIENTEENYYVDALTYSKNIVNKYICLSSVSDNNNNNNNNKVHINPLPKVIISCDTIVALNNEIIEKPKNREDAFNMLKKLSGQMHTVYTAVCIFVFKKNEPILTFVEKTDVYFDELSEKDIKQYLILNEAYDKAGSYGIQGFGAEFINKINGCFYNVMGLPISKLSKTLAHLYENGHFSFE